jgi:pilus assembly protein HofM
VTAAQTKEVSTLLSLATTLRLRVATVTPDAGALVSLLPSAAPAQCVAWRDEHQWLWAMRHQWGRRLRQEAANVAELAALLALSPTILPCLMPRLVTRGKPYHAASLRCLNVALNLP